MTAVQRGEATIGPVAVDGHTLTLVARTRAVHVGGDGRGALHIWSRPAHVEVLDADGRRQVVPIHDVQRALMMTIALGAIGVAAAVRIARARRQ